MNIFHHEQAVRAVEDHLLRRNLPVCAVCDRVAS